MEIVPTDGCPIDKELLLKMILGQYYSIPLIKAGLQVHGTAYS